MTDVLIELLVIHSTLGVIVIIVGNGQGDKSSNPG